MKALAGFLTQCGVTADDHQWNDERDANSQNDQRPGGSPGRIQPAVYQELHAEQEDTDCADNQRDGGENRAIAQS